MASEEKNVTITLNQNQGKEIWVFCPQCGNQTLHKVLLSAEAETRYELGYRDFYVEWEDLQIIECQGCKRLSFRSVRGNSEDVVPDEAGNLVSDETEVLYPPVVIGKSMLRGVEHLPWQVHNVYREVYAVLGVGARVLAGIGIRALVESVCNERGAKGSNLKEKISDLGKQGLLSPQNVAFLQQLRVMGNRSAHEARPHSERELVAAMEIVEHLLYEVYILPEIAKNVS